MFGMGSPIEKEGNEETKWENISAIFGRQTNKGGTISAAVL